MFLLFTLTSLILQRYEEYLNFPNDSKKKETSGNLTYLKFPFFKGSSPCTHDPRIKAIKGVFFLISLGKDSIWPLDCCDKYYLVDTGLMSFPSQTEPVVHTLYFMFSPSKYIVTSSCPMSPMLSV